VGKGVAASGCGLGFRGGGSALRDLEEDGHEDLRGAGGRRVGGLWGMGASFRGGVAVRGCGDGGR
jgi:hypothetical protein